MRNGKEFEVSRQKKSGIDGKNKKVISRNFRNLPEVQAEKSENLICLDFFHIFHWFFVKT
jgi:hypothetical protein